MAAALNWGLSVLQGEQAQNILKAGASGQDDIITRAADHRIRAIAADQRVIAGAGIQAIGAVATIQDIIGDPVFPDGKRICARASEKAEGAPDHFKQIIT